MTTEYITPANTTTSKPSQPGVWQQIKPFAKFGIKAMGIMAGALIAIIKSIPKPVSDNNKTKEIKIK